MPIMRLAHAIPNEGDVQHGGVALTGARPWKFVAAFLVVVLSLWLSGCSDDEVVIVDGGGQPPGQDVGQQDTSTRFDGGGETPDASDTGRRTPSDASTDWDFGQPDDTGEVPFELRRVVPPSGPVAGGNEVRFVGSGLTDATRLFFGSKEIETQLSGETLVGTVPKGAGPGPVTVKAVQGEGDERQSRALTDGYTYVMGVSVDSVVPSRVPTDGGVEVEIRGDGFREPTAVSIGGNSALRLERVDESLLRAVVPPGKAGAADVRVTTPDASALVRQGIEYFEPLDIERVSPASGTTAGGQSVTVHAKGLKDDAEVYFDGTRARRTDIDVNAGTVTVQTPPHAAGLVDVSVRTGDGADLMEDAFLYRSGDAAGLAAVHPDFGPAAGGTEVLLVGTGFDVQGLTVKFGGATATIQQKQPTWVTVKTPKGTPGTVDVSVHGGSGSGEIARLADGFEYREDIWVDAVNPSSGPAAGGTTVEIRGSGFDTAERVLFGGLPASFKAKSDGTIEATAPPHGAGQVDVVVEGNGLEGRLKDGFEYTTELKIWGFTPVRGSMAGGTWVRVRGQGFNATTTVRLGGKDGTGLTLQDTNNLSFYTPSHEPGEVALEVERNGTIRQGPYSYEYFNPASRYGGASGGTVDGSVNVTVLSRGAGPIPGAFVMLSTRPDTPYTGVTDQNGQLTLSGPQVLGPQTVTATAKGFSATTVQTVDAENITVYLSKMEPEMGQGGGGGNAPPMGVIHGKVTAPRKAKDPGEQVTWDMAKVATTRGEVNGRTIDPGDDSVALGNGSYQIDSRIGDVAVVALCGSYDDATKTFDPQYMGIKRYLNVSDGARVRADIVCDIPLDQTLDVKLVNPVYAPSGPDINRAEVWWDFGFEGVFKAPSTGRGLSTLLTVPDQPKLDGPLSDVTMTVIGGSFTGQGSPSTQQRVSEVSDLSKPVVLPPLVDVPEPISPKQGGTLTGNEVRFQASGPYYPDFWSVYFLNDKGRPFWHYLVAGNETSVRFPTLPDLSEIPEEQRPDPMARGLVYMIIMGIDAESATYDNFSYRDLSYSRWRGYSITRWNFQVPPGN